MQYTAINEIQILDGLSFDRLREEAEKTRMRRLPPRTLQHWLMCLGIERDINGQFSEEDLEIIRMLIKWLRRPGNTIEGFKQKLREIYSHAS